MAGLNCKFKAKLNVKEWGSLGKGEDFVVINGKFGNVCTCIAFIVGSFGVPNAVSSNSSIVGNPINMDGTASQSSQSAKDLAKNLSKDITENITLWDERLSSQGAFNLSNELAINSSKKVKKLDENSAQFILQGVLDFYHKKNT